MSNPQEIAANCAALVIAYLTLWLFNWLYSFCWHDWSKWRDHLAWHQECYCKKCGKRKVRDVL